MCEWLRVAAEEMGKQATCCVVLKTKMGMEEQSVECVDGLFNTSFFYYVNSVFYYDNPIWVYFLSYVNYVSLHGTWGT